MRIGLLGGSFNPAHHGHRQVAGLALSRLGLDQVWLLVSPGNPLKGRDGMAPLAERLAGARRIADGRRIIASDIEQRLGTRFTVDTLRALRRRFPAARFVWIMGADGLAELPRWRRWREIARLVPMAVLPRPGWNHRALAGQAAIRLRHARKPAREASLLAGRTGARWSFLPAPQDGISATALRISAASTVQPSETGERIIVRNSNADPEAAKRPAAGRKRPAAAGTRARQDGVTPRKRQSAAGPGRRPATRTPAEPELLQRWVGIITTSLEDDKAEEVVVLDLTGRASFADRMVIATGLADRQISAMANHVEEKLAEAGLRRVRIEGAGGSDWVLLDAGDIVVHLFKPEARALYALERMWGADLDEQPASEA